MAFNKKTLNNKTMKTITMLHSLRPTPTLEMYIDQIIHSKQDATTFWNKAEKPRVMFERMTEKALEVLMIAREEAMLLGHYYVGTEQILLGLVGERTGIVAKVLKSMGIDLKVARIEVAKIIGRGSSSGSVAVAIPFTYRAMRVSDLSFQEARQLGHSYIRPEHLLLGLLREGEGVASSVLEILGADPNNIRTEVIKMMGESAEAVGADVGGGSSGN